MYHKWKSYDVWFLRYEVRQAEFLVILGHFLPFYPTKNQKIKILKNWKTYLEISSFYTSALKMMIICYTVPEIWPVTDVICIFHFEVQPKESKFYKNEKKPWRYHHFTYVYQKLWSHNVQFLRYGAQPMDRRTEKVTYRGGWPT